MTIALTREEAQQVLDAFVNWDARRRLRLIETLRARLAQPEPEPVAWEYCGALFYDKEEVFAWHERGDISNTPPKPLYTAPPQRKWQGLTDEEICTTWNESPRIELWVNAFARAIEAKLKEKNG